MFQYSSEVKFTVVDQKNCLEGRKDVQKPNIYTHLYVGWINMIFRATVSSPSHSTDRMQGIKRMRFDRILNVFRAEDERVYR